MSDTPLTRYLIECMVTDAGGSQIFYVDAHSEAEAMAKYKSEGGQFYEDSAEVLSLGEPCISGITSCDDGGHLGERDLQSFRLDAAEKLVEQMVGALKGVIAVADRATDEFDNAREALAEAAKWREGK